MKERYTKMRSRHIDARKRPRSLDGQEGYMLLAVMLLITIMLIALTVEAPRIAQQIQREKEEELVHRGKEYAMAIKKFYHKTGTYPLSLEQLEDTNHLRFLRKRFKDPMTASGEWTLIHVGQAQITIPTATGLPGGAPGQTGTLTTSQPGAATPSPTPGGFGASPGISGAFNPGGLTSGQSTPGGLTGSQPTPGGQMGTLNTQAMGTSLTGSSQQAGGPIIGVASTSKKTSIKEFNDSDEYDEWLFVYDPRLERVPGGNGVVVAAPRGANSSATSVPAGVVQSVPGVQAPPGTQATPGMQPTPGPMASPTPQAVHQ